MALGALVLIPLATQLGWLPRMLWLTMLWAGVVVSMYLSVLPHELGHAFMAHVVGYRPLAIVWGGFPSVYDGRLFGVRTLIGLAPENGITAYDPIDDGWPRLKSWLITAAGPLVNVLLAALALAAAHSIDGSFRYSVTKFALLSFGIGNAVLAAVNLWPHQVDTVAGRIPSDGARLFTGAINADGDLMTQRAGACQLRMFFAFRDEDYDGVMREAAGAEALAGVAPWIEVSRSAALCAQSKPARAREVLRRALDMTDGEPDTGIRALIENNLAWANFVIDDLADDGESLERSARAYAALPWRSEIVNTRVCVLASRASAGSERLAEARALLERVDELERSPMSRRASILAAGLIAAADGDFDAARRQLEALHANPHPGMAAHVLESRLGTA